MFGSICRIAIENKLNGMQDMSFIRQIHSCQIQKINAICRKYCKVKNIRLHNEYKLYIFSFVFIKCALSAVFHDWRMAKFSEFVVVTAKQLTFGIY